MERLSGMDATFLYLETPAGHMHVAMTAIYDASSVQGGYSFERIKATIEERLPLVPPFRRRLVAVPFQFHHPVWIEDPDFNLDDHVHRVVCPAPGGRRELALIAGQIASEPLDRSRPLWEAWVIEGLKHDRFGFVIKVHHSAVDGAAGAEIMTELFDLDPAGRDLSEVEEIPTEHVPTDIELLSYAAVSKAKVYADTFGLIGRTARSVNNIVSGIRNPARRHGAIPLTAPRTPFNASITPDRSVAFARVPLDDVKAIKSALDVKVNDVVLALCAGTLRKYLEDADALPDEPLIAVCPVSVSGGDGHKAGNQVSAIFTSLATDIDDPLERIHAIANSTVGAKEDHNAIGALTLTDWAEWAAPRTFGLAARLYSSMNLANSHRPIHNLVISNVPGPPFPLYMSGSEMVAAYPMGPIMDGAGLNVTVMSYRDSVDIGFLGCTDLVPDIWDLADCVTEAFDEIKQAVGSVDPTVVKAPAPVTSTRKAARVQLNGAVPSDSPASS
ncbi:MAG TPA: wax ester/triacylglycerol synthase family O-acyltransferase [Microthrixaceae bacterium]|nr:wax ester/triacylglycerol synthase family O-acyltransferase [Microthrixaceae bacterium]